MWINLLYQKEVFESILKSKKKKLAHVESKCEQTLDTCLFLHLWCSVDPASASLAPTHPHHPTSPPNRLTMGETVLLVEQWLVDQRANLPKTLYSFEVCWRRYGCLTSVCLIAAAAECSLPCKEQTRSSSSSWTLLSNVSWMKRLQFCAWTMTLLSFSNRCFHSEVISWNIYRGRSR